jgi:hypothetical protein
MIKGIGLSSVVHIDSFIELLNGINVPLPKVCELREALLEIADHNLQGPARGAPAEGLFPRLLFGRRHRGRITIR